MVVPVVVVVVDVVVVDVVVVDIEVVAPAANAEAAPSAAARTLRTWSQTPRRIAPVCRTVRRFAELLTNYAIGTCGSRFGSIRFRISVRLDPVAVIPWLRRPTTVCAGSGAAATSAATLSASSAVPHG